MHKLLIFLFYFLITSSTALAEIIKKHIGWNGEFTFDLTKPEGVLEKKLDGSLGAKTLNWAPSIKLEDGIRDTVEWYKKNYG